MKSPVDSFLLQGAVVLLMGSKEEDVPNEPKQKAVFVEDMNEDELASAVCIARLKLTHSKTNNKNCFRWISPLG